MLLEIIILIIYNMQNIHTLPYMEKMLQLKYEKEVIIILPTCVTDSTILSFLEATKFKEKN